MTHQTIDYSNSPAKAADAVQDVREWFGRKYDGIAEQMKLVRDPNKFTFYCMLGGVEGYPAKAWYEHFHGEGSWDKAQIAALTKTIDEL